MCALRTYKFTDEAAADYRYWLAKDVKVAARINQLVKDACQTPFNGLGKPEPLKYALAGFWSRRINKSHRLVYRATDSEIQIVSCRFHYK